MKHAARCLNIVLIAALAVGMMAFSPVRAADLPLAAASPLTGVAFDDRPLLLPVQRNFQMAMLTAGSELGRSCGRMEAYGWRMGATEQGRVNQIFNNTVDRLRLMGYAIAPQSLNSVSKDITLFTADKATKHFIFLWSAGELGLVMTLCETTAPIPSMAHTPMATAAPVQVFPVPNDVVSSGLEAAGSVTKEAAEHFTPMGEWVGGYTCEQGYTGGTLLIDHLRGKDFDGVFRFYPTDRNPTVPPGSYTVYGQYDPDSKRILINPGKWIKRPANFYNTIIVGSFDPYRNSFSAYFQGISGCTSFEAKRGGQPPYAAHETAKKHKTVKHVVKKKKPVAKPATAPATDNAPSVTPPAAPAPTTQIVPPAPVTPATPTPASSTTSASDTTPVATSAPAPLTPTTPADNVQVPSLAPSPAPAAPPAPPPAAVPVPSGGGILLSAPGTK